MIILESEFGAIETIVEQRQRLAMRTKRRQNNDRDRTLYLFLLAAMLYVNGRDCRRANVQICSNKCLFIVQRSPFDPFSTE